MLSFEGETMPAKRTITTSFYPVIYYTRRLNRAEVVDVCRWSPFNRSRVREFKKVHLECFVRNRFVRLSRRSLQI